ncbi:hypothetical protein A9W96_23385 [Mycobacterium sp. 1245852.3]|nr:hypothetical protein A9W96_23385 [Mycobacterium sp. 1245852.3]
MHAGAGLLPEMLQHVVDVLGDFFDLVPCVAVDNEHDVVAEVAQGPEPVQQIPNRMLGAADFVGELVDGTGQLAALRADSRCRRTYFVESVIDLVTFRKVLDIQQCLSRVESRLHPVSRRGEAAPTRRDRMHTRHVAVGPQLEDERLHDRP